MAGTETLPGRVAYVMSGFNDRQFLKQIAQGLHPKPDFVRLCERNQIVLFSCDDVTEYTNDAHQIRKAIHRLPRVVLSTDQSFEAVISSGEHVGIPLLTYAHRAHVRTNHFMVVHGAYLARPTFGKLLDLTSNYRTAHYLCLSERIKIILLKCCPLLKNVYNAGLGVDVEFFRSRGVRQEERLIVSAGLASRDYRTLIAAVRDLDARLIIAADSAWYRAPLDLPSMIPPNVQISSCQNYANLRDLYDRASVVVVPLHNSSRAAGYAVIGEAMSMSKSVIATRTDASSDLLLEGQTGLYVEPQDVNDLREKLILLLGDPNLARRFGSAGRRRVEDLYSLDHYCTRIEGTIANSL